MIDYINERIAELSLDEYEDIVAFLNGLEEGDKTLQTLLNEKVDKIIEKKPGPHPVSSIFISSFCGEFSSIVSSQEYFLSS